MTSSPSTEGRTTSMTRRTDSVAARTLTASGRPADRIDQFRRQQADKAIARIEECYRHGLAIPEVR